MEVCEIPCWHDEESSWDERLYLELVPRMFKHPGFVESLVETLGDKGLEIADRINSGGELAKAEFDAIRDAVDEAFSANADAAFTVSWEGERMYDNGVVKVKELAGVFVVASDESGWSGPFTSLESALGDESLDFVSDDPARRAQIFEGYDDPESLAAYMEYLEGHRFFIDWVEHRYVGGELVPVDDDED